MSKLKRSFTIALRGLAVVSLLLILFVGWKFYVGEPTLALWWHITHGNKVGFQGHQMTLPLMWDEDRFSRGPGLHLSRAVILHPLSLGVMWSGTMQIRSKSADLSPEWGGVLNDDAAALRWQADRIADMRSRLKNAYIKPEILHSKLLTFYCVDMMNKAETLTDMFFCKSAGTDWLVLFGSENVGANEIQEQVQEAREILRSME